MWLAVLGPLSVRDDDRDIVIRAGKQRAVLTALLARANRVVSFDELSAAVWEDDPPPTARVTLRNYVKELRRLFGPTARDRILTRDPGYLARFGTDEVDLLRFEALCRRGGTLVRAGEWSSASGVLGEALGLWRGDPLADVPRAAVHRDTVTWLEQQRVQALEWHADAELNLGRPGELVPALRALTERYPLHERFCAQLMTALCRSGRAAEALAAYETARSVLAEQLGADPGPELRRLHERVLRGEMTTARGSAARTAVPPARCPRQLTAAPVSFTGRCRGLRGVR